MISVMVSAISVQVYRVTVEDREPNLCHSSKMSSKQSMNTRSLLFSIVSEASPWLLPPFLPILSTKCDCMDEMQVGWGGHAKVFGDGA